MTLDTWHMALLSHAHVRWYGGCAAEADSHINVMLILRVTICATIMIFKVAAEAAAAQDALVACAQVFASVVGLIGVRPERAARPLPHVARHILCAKRAVALWRECARCARGFQRIVGEIRIAARRVER